LVISHLGQNFQNLRLSLWVRSLIKRAHELNQLMLM
jgi:hypothetical protein